MAMTECQVERTAHQWEIIDVEEGYELQPKNLRKRCIHCHGAVHLYPAVKGSAASAAHFGHNEANPSCPHKKHPKAIN